MQPIEWIVIVVFLGLLGAAFYLVSAFTWCTDQACELFNEAAVETGGITGTQDYTLAVLNGMGTNGNWPLPSGLWQPGRFLGGQSLIGGGPSSRRAFLIRAVP